METVLHRMYLTYQDLLNKAYSLLDNDQVQRVVKAKFQKVVAVGKVVPDMLPVEWKAARVVGLGYRFNYTDSTE